MKLCLHNLLPTYYRHYTIFFFILSQVIEDGSSSSSSGSSSGYGSQNAIKIDDTIATNEGNGIKQLASVPIPKSTDLKEGMQVFFKVQVYSIVIHFNELHILFDDYDYTYT